jgi:hypothetical protein
MPTHPTDEDDRYYKALISTVQDMSQTLGTVREQMSRDLADYLARYREDVHRSITVLHTRVKDVEDLLIRDTKARTERQALLDAALADLKADIEAIKRGGISRDWRIWLILALLVILVVGVWR